MTSIAKQLSWSVIILSLALGLTTLLYVNRPNTEPVPPELLPVSIDVAEVVKEKVAIQVQAQGTVTPLRETAILAEVAGRIIEATDNFNVGGFVEAEEVLLRIDPRDYQTNMLRAEAALETAESLLAQERGRAAVASSEWQKLPRGSQRSPEAKDLYLRKPQLEQAQAQVTAARADLSTARDNLERTIVRAPYDALIRGKHAELGQFVSVGTGLANLSSVEAAEVRLPIPQGKLAFLNLPGLEGYLGAASVDLYTDVGGDISHWTAQLHRTEGVFDERSRVLYTVARIADPYGLQTPEGERRRDPLRIGTFVNANISGREIPDLVTLPRKVMRPGNMLWVVDDSLHLRNRKVSVLRSGGDLLYISAGLNEGDLVSLTLLDDAFEGARVSIASYTPSTALGIEGRAPRVPESILSAGDVATDTSETRVNSAAEG